MDKKYVKEKRLKNTLTSDISSKLVSASEKEPIPKPSDIFESYPNKKVDRKKVTKKDYKKKKVKKIK